MLSAIEADACPSISRGTTLIPITHSVLLIVAMRNVPIGYKPAVVLPGHEERKAHGVFVIAYDEPLPWTRRSIRSCYVVEGSGSFGPIDPKLAAAKKREGKSTNDCEVTNKRSCFNRRSTDMKSLPFPGLQFRCPRNGRQFKVTSGVSCVVGAPECVRAGLRCGGACLAPWLPSPAFRWRCSRQSRHELWSGEKHWRGWQALPGSSLEHAGHRAHPGRLLEQGSVHGS